MVREAEVLHRAAALANIHSSALVTGVGPWPSGFSSGPLAEAVQDGGAVVALGFAGGLDPALKPGDLVTATEIHEESGAPIECDPEMLDTVETVASELGCRPAAAYTSRRPVCTPDEKRELFDKTGASFVTMEDYYFAREASLLGVPFISVRAVVDSADRYVPFPVANMGNKTPASQAVSALSYAAVHPWDLPVLIALGVGASKAARSLERFLQAYLPTTMQMTMDRRDVALGRR